MTEKPQTYVIRCLDCDKQRKISHDDGRMSIQTKDTRHTPKSKACRLQSRVSHTCENCGNETFGIKADN